MSETTRARLGVALWLALSAGCGQPSSTQKLGTNSNWFVSCEDDGACSGATSCHCARCTHVCSSDADCVGLTGARCAPADDAAARSQCGAEDAVGLCLPGCSPGTCPEDQACVAGGCVSSAVPDTELCTPVASASEADRALEDELFDLVQAERAAGGVTCGSNAPSSPASGTLRASGPLRCAARVLAADIDATGTRGLVDSSGRNTQDRLAAAGYAASIWAEAFAVSSSSGSDALAVMLADAAACAGLVRDGYTSLGASHVGRAYVVTLAAE